MAGIGVIESIAKKIALQYGSSGFVSMVLKSSDTIAGTVTYTITFKNGAGTNVNTDIVFTQGKDGANGTNGATIIGVSFVGNDMVFTLNDNSKITLTDAKTTLKGDTPVITFDNKSVGKDSLDEFEIKGFEAATNDTVLIKNSSGTIGYLEIAKNSSNSFSKIASMEYVSEFVQSGLILQGDWDASTNTPNITTVDTQSASFAWITKTAGTQTLGENSITFAEKDWVIKTSTGKYIKLNQSNVTISWGTIGGTVTDQTDLVTYINNAITTKSVPPTRTINSKALSDNVNLTLGDIVTGVVTTTANKYLRDDNTWGNPNPVTTEWAAYTPTITCPGSSFHLVNSCVIKGLYRIVGKNMQLKFIYSHTNNTGFNEGGSNTIPYQISIPVGTTIDATKVNIPSLIASSSNNGSGRDSLPLGHGFYYSGSAPVIFPTKIVPLSSTALGVHLIAMNNTTIPFTLWGCGNSYYGGASVELTFTAEIPIT